MGAVVDYKKWLAEGLERGEGGKKIERMKALAKRLDFAHHNTLYKMISGEREIRANELDKIAEFFGVAVPGNDKPSRRQNKIPVDGYVEAGTFREVDTAIDVPRYEAAVDPDDLYPAARQVAYEVRGDSMNEAGILDGDIIIGVEFQSAGGTLTNGQKVVVEQNRGGMIERSVKAVATFPDRVEFQPRSSNKSHKAIVYPHKRKSGDVEVRVLAIVRESRRRH